MHSCLQNQDDANVVSYEGSFKISRNYFFPCYRIFHPTVQIPVCKPFTNKAPPPGSWWRLHVCGVGERRERGGRKERERERERENQSHTYILKRSSSVVLCLQREGAEVSTLQFRHSSSPSRPWHRRQTRPPTSGPGHCPLGHTDDGTTN